ncbi:hypothetical protein MLAC_25680 [Mycobacterium lacus]|uniref:Uncharacterized protein n=1 Tax=Mycobacterium lacus TaxID=169765 RepID=A0A7I7NKY8_9MYCO|nr:hypothetical protein MLAC_25680 [Mycobacterium lacus]
MVTQPQPAPPRPVLVAVGAIGVEAVGDGVGQPGQLFGPVLGALARQVGLGLIAGGRVDPAGQLVVDAADHRDLTGAEFPGFLRGGRRSQRRR